MVRHEFSYWLTLKGNPEHLKSADAMANKLVHDYLVPDIDGDIPEDERRYCVDPDFGTIEEWSEAEKTISKLADAYPDLFISLSCIDEENSGASHNHVWHAGKTESAYAKVILPDTEELMRLILKPAVYTDYDEAFEALGWNVYRDAKDRCMTISKPSPAGEDFSFDIDGDDIPAKVKEYADDFDIDEHVDLWALQRGKDGAPATYRELVEDAEAIKSMLDELAEALESVQTNCDLGIYDCSTCCIHGHCDREDDAEDDEDDAWEELKDALFMAGHDALEDFLGYEFNPDEDKDTTENRLDEAYQQMPEEELEKFFSKYGVDTNE